MKPQRFIVPNFHDSDENPSDQHQINLHRIFILFQHRLPSTNSYPQLAPGSSSDHRPPRPLSHPSRLLGFTVGTSPFRLDSTKVISAINHRILRIWELCVLEFVGFPEFFGAAVGKQVVFLAVNHQALQVPDILIFCLDPLGDRFFSCTCIVNSYFTGWFWEYQPTDSLNQIMQFSPQMLDIFDIDKLELDHYPPLPSARFSIYIPQGRKFSSPEKKVHAHRNMFQPKLNSWIRSKSPPSPKKRTNKTILDTVVVH